MSAPAIIYLAICAFLLVASAIYHGKPIKPPHDKIDWTTMAGRILLLTALLWWGGFFKSK